MDIIIEITKLYLSFNSIGKIIKNANEGTLKIIVPYEKIKGVKICFYIEKIKKIK